MAVRCSGSFFEERDSTELPRRTLLLEDFVLRAFFAFARVVFALPLTPLARVACFAFSGFEAVFFFAVFCVLVRPAKTRYP